MIIKLKCYNCKKTVKVSDKLLRGTLYVQCKCCGNKEQPAGCKVK